MSIKLPKCIALTIEINPQKVYYQTAEQWINERIERNNEPDFMSEDDKQLCIKNNTIVSVFWYPSTPIGHCEVVGSSLENILNYIEQD